MRDAVTGRYMQHLHLGIRSGAVTIWAAVGALSVYSTDSGSSPVSFDWLGSGVASKAPALGLSLPSRRLEESLTFGAWGVYGGAPAEKRCDSSLFTGSFACCWKNRMTAIITEKLRTRYRWVCINDPVVHNCEEAVAPGNKSLHEEPHQCRRYVHNYVEYSLKMTLYYVLYSSEEPIVLDDTIASNCSIGIRNGTASMLNISIPAVEILAGPTLTTAVMHDGAWVQSLTSSLRFVPDYELDRLYMAAVAEGNLTASERYNMTLENIEAALNSKNVLSDLSALDDHITRSLREMGSALAHVNVEGLNVTTSERNWLGGVIRDSSIAGEVNQGDRACAVLWLSSLMGLHSMMQL